MTNEQAIKLIATRKAGFLLGQIGMIDRPIEIHTTLFSARVLNPMAALTTEETTSKNLHFCIPIHKNEIRQAMENPPLWGENIGDLIRQAMKN